jgi:hypothetical protein
VLLAYGRKNAGNRPCFSIELIRLSLSLAGLSFTGSLISVPDDNAPGFFGLNMQYTSIGYYNRLIINILTRLSGAIIIWEWGGYLLVETLNGLTPLS